MPEGEGARRWWVLGGTCVGLFVLMLDSTAVTLALPSIQGDLDASQAGLQWVQNSYLLVLSALVVAAGRLGDISGRRLVFIVGLAVFAGGSVVAGTAGGEAELVAGRVLQGVGGAAILAQSLAIASHAFPAAEQARALGIWAAVSSLALAVGPLAGGAMIEVSWRLIFLINLPLVALGIGLILWAATESRDPEANRVDLPGAALLSLGLTMVVLALIESDRWGWESAATIGLLAAGVAVLAAFYAMERRVADPLVDFSLFRNRPYLGASAAGFSLVGSYWAVMFYEPQYLQNVLDHPPLAAGALVLPITIPMIFLSPAAGRLIRLFGVRLLMTGGMLCGLAGVLLMTRADASSGYGTLLPGFLLFGISLGLVYAPMSTAAMTAMPKEKAGIASGVLAMNRCMAGALALAVSGALFTGLQHDRLGDLIQQRAPGAQPGDVHELDGLLADSASARAELANQPAAAAAEIERAARNAFTFALDRALYFSVLMLAIGSILTWMLLRPSPRAPPEPEPLLLRHHLHHRRFHL